MFVDGDYFLTVEAIDFAGNSTGPQMSETFTIDTLAPEALVLTFEKLSGNEGRVNIVGLEDGAEWEYSFNGGDDWITGDGTSLIVSDDVAISITARQKNAVGNISSVSEPLVVGYVPSGLVLREIASETATATYGVFVNEDVLKEPGLGSFSFEMEFDPALVRYELGNVIFANGVTGVPNEEGAANGLIGLGGFALPDFTAFETPLVTFDVTRLPSKGTIAFTVTEIELNDILQGEFEYVEGSDLADTIVAANSDSIVRGRSGDDEIDVSAPSVNTIIFEGGSVANGFDTVTGFTLGGALADRIAIAFDGSGQDSLRGDGTGLQITDGGAVGENVGFLVFTTAVDNFENATIDAALTGLTGLNNGDDLYLLIGNGKDAILTALEVRGGTANVATNSDKSYAEFKEIGDLSGFSSANIIGFEQYNA